MIDPRRPYESLIGLDKTYRATSHDRKRHGLSRFYRPKAINGLKTKDFATAVKLVKIALLKADREISGAEANCAAKHIRREDKKAGKDAGDIVGGFRVEKRPLFAIVENDENADEQSTGEQDKERGDPIRKRGSEIHDYPDRQIGSQN